MTVAAARTAAEQLRVALLDHGVRRVSIELQPGVGPKADPWGVAPFVRGLGHHIASYPSQGDTPGLAVVKGGRQGANPLQGPLANCYGGFDLVARIITLGWANHPGAGGPWSVPGWGAVPRDNGRPYILGWEFEGGYLPYTDEMHDFMARCGAGSLDWLGWLNSRGPAPLECWGEHKDPWAPGRKVDRIGYTAASGRARIAAVRSTDSQEDDNEMKNLILALDLKDPTGKVWVGNGIIRRHVPNEQTLKDLRFLIAEAQGAHPDTVKVRRFENIDVLGASVARQDDVGHARDQVAGWLGADPETLEPSEVLTAIRGHVEPRPAAAGAAPAES